MQPQSQLLGGGLSTQPTVQQAVPGTSLPQYVYPGSLPCCFSDSYCFNYPFLMGKNILLEQMHL